MFAVYLYNDLDDECTVHFPSGTDVGGVGKGDGEKESVDVRGEAKNDDNDDEEGGEVERTIESGVSEMPASRISRIASA